MDSIHSLRMLRDVPAAETDSRSGCRWDRRDGRRTGRNPSSPTSMTSQLPTRNCVVPATDRTCRTACFARKHLRDSDVGTMTSRSSHWSRSLIAFCRRLSTPSRWNPTHRHWLLPHSDRNAASNSTSNFRNLSSSVKEYRTIQRPPFVVALVHLVSVHLRRRPARSRRTNCFDNTDMFYCSFFLVYWSGINFHLVR